MLEKINSISDLKKLSVKQLPELCAEIRTMLVDVVTENGGHLASNLGVVELTVALHYVFDENDKLIWDVGHQSYVHKILTGRRDEFHTLRKSGGIKGFPDIKESPSDTFNTGHSGTAISAALGIAKARDINKENFNVIAVCGDGALTGGMTFEALNNIGDTKMLVIYNDNQMSISKNVGSTAAMSRLRIGKYDARKEKAKKFFMSIPLIGKPIWNMLRWFKRVLKLGFFDTNLYFNSFDIKYVGIVDGHNMKKLVTYLNDIKNNVIRPTVLHIRTVKGKGYEPAEKEPQKYHGISPKTENSFISMSDIVGQTLSNLADKNEKIVAVTCAMTDGTGLTEFSFRHKDRFFDTGITEEHAVTFCAGLAAQKMKPYFVVYSTFLQRGFDQILHDVCIQNLPVTFCIDRAGLVGFDGKTHQGVFDFSYLSALPNMTVFSPADESQLKDMLEYSVSQKSPLAIRYPKSIEYSYGLRFDGKWNEIRESKNGSFIIATGNRMLRNALNIAQKLDLGVIYATTIKPLDNQMLDTLKDADIIFTLEENILSGGLGEAVMQYMSQFGVRTVPFSVPDKFIEQGDISEQLAVCGLDEKTLLKKISSFLTKK
ncbi:MAG TPA: 1-deoxy-D-xylulose-5-phosphate synthase [Clostridia bacterium]|nr:1-deoxy-D-xylulose-5-phosphate synthase [Clostridia bacterium]